MEKRKPAISDEILDDLIGPVCHIAALQPTNEWPHDLQTLIGLARRVKDGFGFHTETLKHSRLRTDTDGT